MRDQATSGTLSGMSADAVLVSRPTFALTRSDVVWPVLLACVVQVDVWAPHPFSFGNMVGPRVLVSLLYAVTSLALIWRRQAPLLVLAFVVSLDSVVYLVFGAPEGLGSFLPLLAAFCSVGRYAPASSVFVAGPLAILGLAIHELEDPAFQFNGSTTFFWVVLAAGWPLGFAFQRRAVEAEALTGRARRLAVEREASELAAIASERARIARELHDIVGHGLSVIVLQLVAALGSLDKSDVVSLRERLLSTEQSARDALDEMRRLLDLLDDGDAALLTPQPGLDQLDRLVADTRAAGAEVDVTITGDRHDIPAGVELAAFRIIQESLTNVLKHASPPRAHVLVGYEPHAITIQVRDDGRSSNGATVGGRGLAGIRERVALYGGELDLGQAPEGGYLVRARLPVTV
jgi:signal transduction histidine kinase